MTGYRASSSHVTHLDAGCPRLPAEHELVTVVRTFAGEYRRWDQLANLTTTLRLCQRCRPA